MDIALTRATSPHLSRCELVHRPREPIDPDRAAAEHEAYEAALRALGLDVRRVAPAPERPDGVFVEDAAVVLDELAVITRPGARSRRAEVEDVAAALSSLRPLARVPAPATLDGGDVLVDGRTIFVGATVRTNTAGHAWLAAVLGPAGYDVRVVPVTGCLHLKTAVTRPAPGMFLLNPDWVRAEAFDGERIEVDPAEPHAANVLAVGATVLCAEGTPGTRRRLESHGFAVEATPLFELARAEAGVTCCSVIVPRAGGVTVPPAAAESHIPRHEEGTRE